MLIYLSISFPFIQYISIFLSVETGSAYGREPEDESGTPDVGEDLSDVPLPGQSHEEGEINQGTTWEERKLGSRRKKLEHCKQFFQSPSPTHYPLPTSPPPHYPPPYLPPLLTSISCGSLCSGGRGNTSRMGRCLLRVLIISRDPP